MKGVEFTGYSLAAVSPPLCLEHHRVSAPPTIWRKSKKEMLESLIGDLEHAYRTVGCTYHKLIRDALELGRMLRVVCFYCLAFECRRRRDVDNIVSNVCKLVSRPTCQHASMPA